MANPISTHSQHYNTEHVNTLTLCAPLGKIYQASVNMLSLIKM